MSNPEWRRYRLSWRLASPLHIGYRTIGTIARTRLWVPGRNVWGALIDTLARAKGAAMNTRIFGDVQTDINDAVRFEAWFLGNNPELAWMPQYSETGLRYGYLPKHDMQRLVLGASVSTAIDHGPGIAEEGMLFETEYIAPATVHAADGIAKGINLWLVGHLWLKSGREDRLLAAHGLVPALQAIRMGGEQKSGYGRLVDGTVKEVEVDGRYTMEADGTLTIPAHTPFPLLVASKGVHAERGQVEPILGRFTKDSGKHGASLERVEFCWLPGSVCQHDSILSMMATTPGIAGANVQSS